MAATLAVHLRGLPPVPYDQLRKVSDYYFDIPSYALKSVVPILQEVGFVQVVRPAASAETVIPTVPFFDDVHATLGEYAATQRFTEHEQVTAAILARLFESPRNKDALRNSLGADGAVFERCIAICRHGSLAVERRARGRDIVVSPYYFADNLSGLVDAAAAGRAPEISRVIGLIRDHQGWPLTLVEQQQEIAGHRLSREEVQIVQLLSENLLFKQPSIQVKQPSIQATSGEPANFVFTPRPGPSRLNATNREIYERAMAIVAAVRRGQLLAANFPIASPRALLQALKERGRIGQSSEAATQYQKLVEMRVGRLVPAGGDHAAFHLLQSEENEQAVDLAISLVTSGDTAGAEVNRGAREALKVDERYINHLLSASGLKQRRRMEIYAGVKEAAEQLIFGFMSP